MLGFLNYFINFEMIVHAYFTLGLLLIPNMCNHGYRGSRGGNVRRISRLISNRSDTSSNQSRISNRNLIDLTPGHHDGARSFATGNVSLQQKQKTADQADLIHQPKHKSADRKNLVYVKCGEFASKRDNFSISLANCQSIKNKTDLILDTLCTYRFSIMFLTETWINNNDSDLHMKNATPTGYSFLHRPRSNGQLGGGIGAIVHNDIKHVDASSEIRSFASFEHMAIHTTKSGLSVWYYLIYRPPPSAANGLSRAQFSRNLPNFLRL